MINTFKNFLNSVLLQEGGQAAINMVEKLKSISGNQELVYQPASPTPNILNEINKIREILLKNNLIEPKESSYVLGSSRLFAIASGKKKPEEITDKVETKELVKMALKQKTHYGDIDLDVDLKDGVSTQDLVNAVTSANPKKYAGEAIKQEAFFAVNVDNTNQVIQIDVVDLGEKPHYFKHKQFSSIADLAHGITGAQRDLLETAIVATHPIDSGIKELIKEEILNSEVYKEFVEKRKKKNANAKFDVDIRPSLTGDGFTYKVKFIVDDKSTSYSKGGVTFDRIAKIIDMKKKGIPQIVPYEAIEDITKELGFGDSTGIKHFIKMVEFVKNLKDNERKQKIFNMYIEHMKPKIPNQIKPQAAVTGIRYFLNNVEGIDSSPVLTLHDKGVQI